MNTDEIALALATLALSVAIITAIAAIALACTFRKSTPADSSTEPRELTQTELDLINGQQGRYSTNADGTIKPRRQRKPRTPKPAPEAPTDAATTASASPSVTEPVATTTTTGEPTHATQQP